MRVFWGRFLSTRAGVVSEQLISPRLICNTLSTFRMLLPQPISARIAQFNRTEATFPGRRDASTS